jgi:RNA polymerase sigma-70 factor, ECF subfamily
MQIHLMGEGLTGISDMELVRLSQQGSERAFGELMSRHSRVMHQIAYGILRDQQESEDELQNAWWKAWLHINSFAREARFSTWLTRIVMNQLLMFLYLDALAPADRRAFFELRDATDSAEQVFRRHELCDLVRRETGRLPLLPRHALVLREVNQLPMPDVAKELGISLPAAKSRLLRGVTSCEAAGSSTADEWEPQVRRLKRRFARMGFVPWRYRLMVRTEPSQGLNTGSTPVSATNSFIIIRL